MIVLWLYLLVGAVSTAFLAADLVVKVTGTVTGRESAGLKMLMAVLMVLMLVVCWPVVVLAVFHHNK